MKQVFLPLWILFLCFLDLHQQCGPLFSDILESVLLKKNSDFEGWFWLNRLLSDIVQAYMN